MNLKILYYSSVYNELVENFEITHKNYQYFNFAKHTKKFMEFSRGQEFSYQYYLNQIGYDVDVIYYNYHTSKKWAFEEKILNKALIKS